MTDSGDFTPVSQPLGALERAQAVSRALSDAARRARFAARARGGGSGSFAARQGAKLIRIVIIALFVIQVAIPNLVASVYFGLLASDQYVSEAKFTVSSGAIPKMDSVGSVTGLPPIIIIQDTQLIANYIRSRPMVEQLSREVGLLDAYSADGIDWWARFRRSKPIEKFTDYWTKMSGVSIGFPSGIVTVTVRAFMPEDAKRIADRVVALSEQLINDLNERMRNDTIAASEADMKRAQAQLVKARIEMEAVRNAEGTSASSHVPPSTIAAFTSARLTMSLTAPGAA